jgi:hypothetical protein
VRDWGPHRARRSLVCFEDSELNLKRLSPPALTSQGAAHGRFQRAIHRRHVQAAEVAAREMGGLSLYDALSLCELLVNVGVQTLKRSLHRA